MNGDRTVGVIGGGPAGLAAAAAAARAGWDVLVWDEGEHHVLRSRNHSLASGLGGAGLFSDGKFSYYPSGSRLYELEPPEALKCAYQEVTHILDEVGIATEPPPNNGGWQPPTLNGRPVLKNYPSHYGSLESRYALMDHMVRQVESGIVVRSKVKRILSNGGSRYIVRFERDGKEEEASVSRLVLAMGRFGNLALERLGLGSLSLRTLRYEAGVRIETPADNPFFASYSNCDIKLRWQGETCEFRTFCTCRNGEVWCVDTDGLFAISGRADGVPTGFSNFGLLARFTGEHLTAGQEWWQDLMLAVRNLSGPIWTPLVEILEPSRKSSGSFEERPWFPEGRFQRGVLAELLPRRVYATLREGILGLLQGHPELAVPETVCVFPTVESSGIFLNLDSSLRVQGSGISVAGDQAGTFRGLVPALVSGYFVGSSL